MALVGHLSQDIHTLNSTMDVLLNALIEGLEATKLKEISSVADTVKASLAHLGSTYEQFNGEYSKLIALNKAQGASIGKRDQVIEKLEKDMATLLEGQAHMTSRFETKLTSEIESLRALLMPQSVSQEKVGETKRESAFVLKVNGKLYFANPLDKGALYEMNEKEVGLKKLGTRQYPSSMKAYRETIYFINTYDASLSIIKEGQVKRISERKCKCFEIGEEAVYVGCEEGLYELDLEGREKACLYEGEIEKIDVVEKQIYFVSEGFLYGVTSETEKVRQIL